MAYDADPATGFAFQGEIDHDRGTIRRSFQIGDYLYTVGTDQIKVNAMSDLSAVASVDLRPPPEPRRPVSSMPTAW